MYDLRTYRAKSLAEALRLVRDDLGPEASLLYTRRTSGGLWRWAGGTEVEVTASVEVQAPLRLGELRPLPSAEECDYRSHFRAQLLREVAASVEELGDHGSLKPMSHLDPRSSREA
jgi:flagellar biosynthesis GTPase FlhF